MFFHQRFVPGLAIASYIVGDDKTKEVAVVDPTRDVDDILRLCRANGNLKIRHILETHVHADFVSGAVELKNRLGGDVAIHSSAMGGAEWTAQYADHPAKDGDEIRMGCIRLRCVHSPGHTPEHICWELFDDSRSHDTPWLIFTGDFLFVGDVGRPDLLGEEARNKLAHELYQSTFDRFKRIPDFVEIFPAHGAGSLCGKAIGSRRSSSIGFERRFNPSLQPLPETEWVAHLMHAMPPAPPYFKRMKRINVKGPPLLGERLPGDRAIPAVELKRLIDRDEAIVLDVRPREQFASNHILGSLHIELAPNLASWAGWIVPDDRRIVLVVQNEQELTEAVTQLIRIGLDNIAGYLEGGVEAWMGAGFKSDALTTISPRAAASKLGNGDYTFLLDVRTDGEWNSAHIHNAAHIFLGFLDKRSDELPKDRQIMMICGSGYRSSIAGSILQRKGFADLISVAGGMDAWLAEKLPAEH
jgi:hydroxyacylglutathione hydrolase